jgi:CDP-diacylglycerol--glycerol-3-phosphate 3-phosphatidyltransferase
VIDTHGRKYVQPIFDKGANILIRFGLTPIKVTFMALVMGLISIVFLLFDEMLLSVIFLWISGILDVLDGTVARKAHKESELGAFLDITFDRIIELGIIISLAILNPKLGIMLVVLTASIAMSLTIFLTVSSFAQNNGDKAFYYQAGVAERTEGFILFTLMILWVDMRLIIGYIFALVVVITAVQRFYEGIKILKDDSNG